MHRVKEAKFFESNGRSVLKAVTFRLAVLAADSIIIYFITRRADVTIGVMIFSNVSSTVLYFLHERVWNTVHWGKVRRHR